MPVYMLLEVILVIETLPTTFTHVLVINILRLVCHFHVVLQNLVKSECFTTLHTLERISLMNTSIMLKHYQILTKFLWTFTVLTFIQYMVLSKSCGNSFLIKGFWTTTSSVSSTIVSFLLTFFAGPLETSFLHFCTSLPIPSTDCGVLTPLLSYFVDSLL